MGAVGGRSRGCHTCRRRRVKCDESQPTCGRCAKSKLDCEGYARDLKFVDEKERAQKRVKLKKDAYRETTQSEKEQGKLVRLDQKGQSDIRMNQDLSLVAFRRNLQVSFMVSNLFLGSRKFIPGLLDSYRDHELCTTTQTVKALSSLFFGRMHRHQPSLQAGMVLYTKALRLLGADLQSLKSIYMLESITNVLSLCIFEMMASRSGAGLMQHGGGMEKLIQIRGPERHQTLPELSVFESGRMAIAHNYMERKKRCFLEQPKWLTVPWDQHPEAKNLLSRLFDRICYLPGLLEDMETLRTQEQTSPGDIQEVSQKVDKQLRELFTWRAAWELANPHCSFEATATCRTAPYVTATHFTSLPRAYEISLYHSALTILFRIGRILEGPTFSVAAAATSVPIIRTNSTLLLPSETRTVHDVAMEILKAVEYELLEPHQNSGCFQLLFPLRVAFEVFTPGSGEWEYVERIFAHIADSGAFEVGRGMMPSGLCGRFLVDETLTT